MRLLQDDGNGDLSLVEYDDGKIPAYSILSHTWGPDGQEVIFKDLMEGTGRDKAGFEKIEFCRKRAASDGIQYFWVDTCCIDKSSSAELSKAINSMFRWYQNADKCYVFLSDVSTSGNTADHQSLNTTWEAAFRESRWFRRGWTLQELIAPARVEFFSREGYWLGSKETLEQDIHQITRIAIKALRGDTLSNFTTSERMSWATRRETKHPEDKAYSLLGIFNVFMPLLYAEGEENAFARLQEEIRKSLKSPAEQIEFLPSPSSTVPFRRDVDFVDRRISHDRGTLLEQIEQQCAAPAARVALVGIGGTGKSQLAIEHCYRLRDRSSDMWVFWIHASNTNRIEQGYREIAERVKILGRTDPKQNIFELVARWLRDEMKRRWVLVLDNLDDDAVLLIPQATTPRAPFAEVDSQLQRPLSTYLPQSPNGKILITTRTRSVATKLVESRDIIPVDPMTDPDAIKLLQKKLDGVRDEHDLKELARILEYMPLAIAQAAAYIQEKGATYSVRQYIKAFQRNEKQKTSLLNYEAGQLRRDPDAKNSIIITWQISFNEIREKWPASADLLSLMSYFDRQGIPTEVLKAKPQENIDNRRRQEGDSDKDDDEDMTDSGASDASHDDMFEDAVDRLRSYSFVSIGEDRGTFEMHALVQLATRKWLEMHGEDERWKAQFCRKLSMVFPTGTHKNWDLCETLFPHAKSAERQRPMGNTSVREWARILWRAGWYALARGDYNTAERMCEKSARALSRQLGGDDVEISYSLGILASTYRNQGRWTEAEQMNVQVMETRKRVLGDEHPETLAIMNNLASTYWYQGRWTEAEQLNVQVMKTRKRVLGEEHPDTLNSMANLASTYWNQGRWAEAGQIEVQVLDISRRVLGEEHPDTLSSIADLASTYRNQGRWMEAEHMEVQVVETRKRVLGEEHPHTLSSIGNLASTYRKQGRWMEAGQMEVQVMETSRRVLGEEHPNTLNSIANLASTYRNQGRWMEAEHMQVQVVETRKRVLGEEHPHTLTSMGNLALTYRNQGRWTEAEQINIQVMETRKRVLGEEHPDTLTSIANLASTYWSQGRWTEAEKMDVQVLETRRRVIGEEHPSTLNSMNDLAFTMKDQGRKGEAIKLMVECVQLRNQILGIEHPDARSSAAALAKWQDIE